MRSPFFCAAANTADWRIIMEEKKLTLEERKARDAYRFEHRFDEAEAVMGKAAADAMRKLYDFYGKDWLDWLASLYDPERGAFYYANSALYNTGH